MLRSQAVPQKHKKPIFEPTKITAERKPTVSPPAKVKDAEVKYAKLDSTFEAEMKLTGNCEAEITEREVQSPVLEPAFEAEINPTENAPAEVTEPEVQSCKLDSTFEAEMNHTVNPPAEVKEPEVQWEVVVRGNVEAVPPRDRQEVPNDSAVEVVMSANEICPQQSEGTQLTESEALQFLSGSEAYTQKTDDDQIAKPNKEQTGEVLAVQVNERENQVAAVESNGDDADSSSKMPYINELQEGVKNMIMGENDERQ